MIPLRDNIKSKTFPFINWGLIIANAYVFYLELRLPSGKALDQFMHTWAVVPSVLFASPSHHAFTLFTATFLHGGWMHIISNMYFLYIFGNSVEDCMGHLRYLVFYLLVGVLANGTQAYLSAGSSIPMLGASGAIAGVLGAYFFNYPHARVLTLLPVFIFIRIIEVPAFLFLGLWFVLQAFNGTASLGAEAITGHHLGGTAWWAHVGGFVAGLLLTPMFAARQGKFK